MLAISLLSSKKPTNLSWYTSGNNNNLDTFQCLVKLVCSVTDNLHTVSYVVGQFLGVKTHLTSCVDVADIRCNTRSSTNIVQAQRGNQRVALEEQ